MSAAWRAGHLPGLAPGEVHWQTLRYAAQGGYLDVEVPLLTDPQMQALAAHVRRAAQARLQPMTVDAVIGVIDRAVARLLDEKDPVRREADALLPIVTGFDAEMVRLGLTAYLLTFRAPQLQRFVAQDFANPKVLDGFQPALKGGAVRAFGPALLAHVWAGNVPGLPLWSLACGLLVKAGNIGKLPSAEPVFATLFARLLCEVHPPLADCLAVVWWKGGQPGPAATLYRASDTVLAYGGNAALREVREQVPASTRFIAYGHKLGVTLVGRAALDRERGPAAARRAALDVVRWEQQGCYSSHAVYVERGVPCRRATSRSTWPPSWPTWVTATRAARLRWMKPRPSQPGAVRPNGAHWQARTTAALATNCWATRPLPGLWPTATGPSRWRPRPASAACRSVRSRPSTSCCHCWRRTRPFCRQWVWRRRRPSCTGWAKPWVAWASPASHRWAA